MQRVEPSNVHAFSGPLIEGAQRATSAKAAAAVEHKILEDISLSDEGEPPHVEVRAVRIPVDSSGFAPWASVFFMLFWLGGIGAYLVGLFGWDKLFQLPTEWYGLISAVLIVPVILAAFIAVLAREAKILRRQSSALAVAAAELTEPDDHAARGLTRLGRVIRHELDTFNHAVEAATQRMTTLEQATNERLALIERTAIAAQERVDKATGKLGAEREKLAQFTHALDTAVLSASETLTARLHEARVAAKSASESLNAEHGALTGLISTLHNASNTVATKAAESAKEIERQAQRLDAASEAAAARSEQVVARHERQRAALAETIERLKAENDHMARALDYQRDGMNKLVGVMSDETKKIGAFTVEGARRLDETAAIMAQRIIETTQLFTRESDKLRTSTELTTSGLAQAMQTISGAGESSVDAAGRLGSVLLNLRETAAGASQQIEATVMRLAKLLQDLPSEAAGHAQHLRLMLDQQAGAINDLSSRVSTAFDRVQALETRPQPQLKAPPVQQSIPDFTVPPAGHLAPPVAQRAPMQQTAAERQFAPPPVAAERQYAPPPVSAERQFAPPPAADRQFAPPQQSDGQNGNGEQRGWFGLAKRFVRPGEGPDMAPPSTDDRGGWDMKSLLAAAEGDKQHPQHPPHQQPVQHRRVEPRMDRDQRPQRHEPRHPQQQQRAAQHPQHPQHPQHVQQQRPDQNSAGTSSRHMIETLQAMAIDLDRFLEDDPPLDLLRRYRNGERNVFAKRLVAVLGREQTDRIGRKYREDGEFKDTVDRYIIQFESLMEQTARTDRDNVLVETYLTSQTGKVYVALASATGRFA